MGSTKKRTQDIQAARLSSTVRVLGFCTRPVPTDICDHHSAGTIPVGNDETAVFSSGWRILSAMYLAGTLREALKLRDQDPFGIVFRKKKTPQPNTLSSFLAAWDRRVRIKALPQMIVIFHVDLFLHEPDAYEVADGLDATLMKTDETRWLKHCERVQHWLVLRRIETSRKFSRALVY
ncbi:hypothetical protein BDU57DRAFT_25648 [Ampelomyces quisqualis]|uniref:Uncharacterized protein n=1 Tax=Ampelomyces quisqualis TaxID=50730 RepID=A0A6A5QYG5_AMPQU|nr:hypothetical protein BDU57DRAFT_25648 [Ampelomyces quisqualis]